MVVTQQEIELFRTVLANKPEYAEAQEALAIIAENEKDLAAAYPLLSPKTVERGRLDDLKEQAQKCYDKCREQLDKVDRTQFVHASVEAVFHIVLAYAAEAGITQGIVVGIVFVLLKQRF